MGISPGKLLLPLLAAGYTVLGCSPAEPPAPAPTGSTPEAVADDLEVTDDPAPATMERPSPVSLEKEDCGQYETQQDMNQCAARNYEISDGELNQLYQKLNDSLSSSGQDSLTAVEEQWIGFRDGQCQLESQRYAGGSIAPLIRSSCLERITDDRIATLAQTHQTDQSYAAIDARLNQVYQDLRQTMDAADQEALTEVQLDWLAYRDAHCEFEVQFATDDVSEDSCLADVTEIRVWQLESLQESWSL